MEKQQYYRKPFIFSIALHGVVFLLLAMGFQFRGQTFVLENSKTPQIINAVVMSATPPLAKLLPPEPIKTALPPPPQSIKQLPPKVIPIEKPKVIPLKKDVIALKPKKQKIVQESQIEKQLLAELNQHRVMQKKLKQKALEDAFQSEIKNLAAKKQQAQQERMRINSEREQKAQGVVDKYKALVLQAIGEHWLIPNGVDKKLATELVIYLAPGGAVLDTEIYKSSGNVALDNSARAAVFKASPLPVPTDAEGFKFFRRFVLVFRPMYFQNAHYEEAQ